MSTRPCEQDLQQMVTLTLTYPHVEDECSIYHDQVLQVTGLPCHALSSILLPLPFFHLKTHSPLVSFLVLVKCLTLQKQREHCLLFNPALPPLAHLKNVTSKLPQHKFDSFRTQANVLREEHAPMKMCNVSSGFV